MDGSPSEARGMFQPPLQRQIKLLILAIMRFNPASAEYKGMMRQ
jgi:hypothetical protein